MNITQIKITQGHTTNKTMAKLGSFIHFSAKKIYYLRPYLWKFTQEAEEGCFESN